MPDRHQLPHLVRLFDDPSPTVQQAVLDAFAQFGEELEEELQRLDSPPSDALREDICVRVRNHLRSGEGPRFSSGHLIVHRLYHYRGVIVDYDLECKADDGWYRSNQTQPPRNQPWYHVLVDGTDQIKYVAESNLDADESGSAVEHPLITHFFSGFENGAHIRNDRPWGIV